MDWVFQSGYTYIVLLEFRSRFFALHLFTPERLIQSDIRGPGIQSLLYHVASIPAFHYPFGLYLFHVLAAVVTGAWTDGLRVREGNHTFSDFLQTSCEIRLWTLLAGKLYHSYVLV